MEDFPDCIYCARTLLFFFIELEIKESNYWRLLQQWLYKMQKCKQGFCQKLLQFERDTVKILQLIMMQKLLNDYLAAAAAAINFLFNSKFQSLTILSFSFFLTWLVRSANHAILGFKLHRPGSYDQKNNNFGIGGKSYSIHKFCKWLTWTFTTKIPSNTLSLCPMMNKRHLKTGNLFLQNLTPNYHQNSWNVVKILDPKQRN